MFENRVLREIFGPKKDEVERYLIKSHNEELNDKYCSPNVIRVRESNGMGCEGHAPLSWGEQNCIQSFGREPDGKRELVKSRRRWEYDIK